MTEDNVIIRVRDLWKSFGSLQVLKGMNLDVLRGETLVIMGRSGVGKSVLLRHLMGLVEADSGTIEIEGKCITKMSTVELLACLKNVGMLFQGSALFDSMSVYENIAFYLREHGKANGSKTYTEKEIGERVSEALGMVGLAGTEHKMPADLSGGMRRRAALARVIVYRPEIILYDEPTTGLDPVTGKQINELICQIQRDLKATSIVVTHDVHSALLVGDRIAFHDNGVLTHIDQKSKFFQIDDDHIRAFIDATAGVDHLGLGKK